jgi:anti-sigma factor RsiW
MTTPSHETFREQLLDLAYGELGSREAHALKKHLAGCAECRAELTRMTATRSAMSGLADEPAPERGEAILLAAAREAVRGRARRPYLPSWVWGASASAVAAVALAVVAVKLAEPSTIPGLKQAPPELVASSPQPPAEEAAPAVQPAAPGASAEAGARLGGASADKADEVAPAKPVPPRAAPAKERRSFAKAPAANGTAGPQAAGREDASQPKDDLKFDGYARGDVGGKGGAVAGKSKAAELDAGDRARSGELALAEKKEAERSRAAPSAAPEPAPPPPPASAAASPAPSVAEEAPAQDRDEREQTVARKAAAPAVRAAEDAMGRHTRLRLGGRLRTETRAFAGCAGEAERTVELDERGTPVKLTRRGAFQGKPYTAELFYGEDGVLGAVRWSSEGRVHEFRAGPPGTSISAQGIPASAFQPQRAADAGPDAPARCGP